TQRPASSCFRSVVPSRQTVWCWLVVKWRGWWSVLRPCWSSSLNPTTLTSMMKRMNTVALPLCLRRGGVAAGSWEASPCAEAGPAVIVGMTECLPAEGCVGPCLPPAAITTISAPAGVLLRPTPVGLAGEARGHETCQWVTHIEG
ncbi:hypothetical protein GOODEAATRI_013802, partial [Goodea atripinnis]